MREVSWGLMRNTRGAKNETYFEICYARMFFSDFRRYFTISLIFRNPNRDWGNWVSDFSPLLLWKVAFHGYCWPTASAFDTWTWRIFLLWQKRYKKVRFTKNINNYISTRDHTVNTGQECINKLGVIFSSVKMVRMQHNAHFNYFERIWHIISSARGVHRFTHVLLSIWLNAVS